MYVYLTFYVFIRSHDFLGYVNQFVTGRIGDQSFRKKHVDFIGEYVHELIFIWLVLLIVRY